MEDIKGKFLHSSMRGCLAEQDLFAGSPRRIRKRFGKHLNAARFDFRAVLFRYPGPGQCCNSKVVRVNRIACGPDNFWMSEDIVVLKTRRALAREQPRPLVVDAAAAGGGISAVAEMIE